MDDTSTKSSDKKVHKNFLREKNAYQVEVGGKEALMTDATVERYVHLTMATSAL